MNANTCEMHSMLCLSTAHLRESTRNRLDKMSDEMAEIDKLRELVRVFYYCTTSGVCDYCPVNGGGGAVHLMPDTICDTMHDRMRELGVEVEQ